MKSSNYLRRAKRKSTEHSDAHPEDWQDKVIGKNYLVSLLNIHHNELENWLAAGMPYLRQGGINREWEFDLIAVKQWLREHSVLLDQKSRKTG